MSLIGEEREVHNPDFKLEDDGTDDLDKIEDIKFGRCFAPLFAILKFDFFAGWFIVPTLESSPFVCSL